MIVARPFYAARIPGAPDVPVSVRTSSGRYTLDAGRAPMVEGGVELAIPDVAILEDLDPRDGRRLVVDVYPESHLEPTYSPWVEQHRNLFFTPTFADGSMSALYNSSTEAVSDGILTITAGVNDAPSLFAMLYPVGLAPNSPWSARMQVRRRPGDSANRGLSIRPTSYLGGSGLPWATVGSNALVTLTDEWQDVEFSGWKQGSTATSMGVQFVRTGPWPLGQGFQVRQVIMSPTEICPDFFVPGDTDELRRTRWIATANLSASVVETRTLTGYVQVPDGSPRTFDLGIREATPLRRAGTTQLQLASDEALLDDFAQLADDKGPRAHQASLRAVVNYVLAKIGASLEPGDEDADVTAYWAITNLLSNPSLEVNADGWLPGTGASALTRVSNSTIGDGSWALRWTASAGTSNVVPASSSNSFHTVKPGEWYVFAFSIATAITGGRQARAAIQWWSQGGSVPSATAEGALGLSIPASSTRMYVIAQCPPGADRAVPFVNTIGNTGGELHYVDSAMFYAGDELVPFFNGSTPDSAFYIYDWQAAPHASTSTRKPIIDRPPAALTMKAGVSGLAFLVPLIQAAGFRLLCNERREWTLRSAEYRAAGSQTFREGVNVIDATEKISRSSDEWFDGIVIVYTWTDDDGIEQTRVDAYSLPGATKVIRREIRAPFPGPGRAQYAVKRAQGRGRIVTATKQADWTETADQEFSALLDGAPIQIGTANRVELNIGENTVTTTSRTTDTPAGAIVLLPGTILNLPGTINTL